VLMSTYRLDREIASALYDFFVKGFNDDGSCSRTVSEYSLRIRRELQKWIATLPSAKSRISRFSERRRGNWELNKFDIRS
jgi:hypothetical protein